MRGERSADSQMRRGPLAGGNQLIRGFLHAVVSEHIVRAHAKHQSAAYGLPHAGVGDLLRFVLHPCQRRDIGHIAEARELSQHVTRFGGQAAELRSHQVGDVVGIALCADARQIPRPYRGAMIEADQAFIVQRGQKLDREKRIAACLLMHELRKRLDRCAVAVQRIGSKLRDASRVQRLEHDLLHVASRATNRIERARKRVRRIDFVVAVCADQ
ncbi:hypothetical protein BgramDRAFT_6104 [Paraburkholderia graminis C4D1M]|uniref:Uncharacterized protein n=1 Tax=Paraburkholderia graminis (strain ATCC 700544 / DSM 17151 / LMG 18924 / NCIMB 13744 / C4D1M) TaxID=396598 RepID=B1G9Q8_PARG4|nr:hypothetical protein BgramDRAFT_6104 [Paraburkholderia graminis C4D1M]